MLRNQTTQWPCLLFCVCFSTFDYSSFLWPALRLFPFMLIDNCNIQREILIMNELKLRTRWFYLFRWLPRYWGWLMSTVGVLFCFSLAAMTHPRTGSKIMSESYIFFFFCTRIMWILHMQKQCWSLARIVGSYNFSWSICPISDNDQRWEKKNLKSNQFRYQLVQ